MQFIIRAVAPDDLSVFVAALLCEGEKMKPKMPAKMLSKTKHSKRERLRQNGDI